MDRDRLKLDTPEGLALDLVLAGPGTRALAALFDLLLQGLVLAAVALIVMNGVGGSLAAAVLLIFGAAFVPGYHVFFETRSAGQTPGKLRMKLRVLRTDGGPVSPAASLVRNLLRLVDFLPASYFVGAAAIFMTSLNQRLGDLAAGTIVVIEPSDSPRPDLLAMAPPLARRAPEEPTWDVTAITAEEVALIRAFLARRATLPNDARSRLAEQLAHRVRDRVATPGTWPAAEDLLEGVVRRKSQSS